MTAIKPIKSNMIELHTNNGNVILFSYETPVAALIAGKGYVRTATKYSVTTSKHINQWLDGVNAAIVPQVQIDALTD